MTDTAFSVERGAREIWEFHIQSAMTHPVHVHVFSSGCSSERSPGQVRRLAVDARVFCGELGWKDTVLLWPGETLSMMMDSTIRTSATSLLLQCHNREHETTA